MEIVLSVLMVVCALSAVFGSRAEASLAAAGGAGFLLAARIAIDDPLLAAAVALYAIVTGSVSFLHLRRHDTAPEGRRGMLPLVLGLALAGALMMIPPPASGVSAEQSLAPVWPTAGMLVIIAALALLIGSTLVVRFRHGRRR